MNLTKHKKIDVVKQMLETALKLYFKGNDYFSVLHIAGACDEVSGKYLKLTGAETSVESNVKAFKLIKKTLSGIESSNKDACNIFNSAKNSIKHMNDSDDSIIVMDPKDEAEEMLDRALTNMWRLDQPITRLMEKFFQNKYD